MSVPVLLALLGLLRGAPVELASCCGCLVGVVAAWTVSAVPAVQGLGEPMAPLTALASGVVAWRVTRTVSQWVGLDTRWVDLGRIFDGAAGFSMGAFRGVALVSAGCLAYAMIFVPLGLADPAETVIYPVFLGVGSQVTRAVMAEAAPAEGPAPSTASVPASLPVGPPFASPSRLALAAPIAAPGAALATLLHSVAPSAAAATMLPPQTLPTYHPDIPVRQFPAALIETHHNIAHPRGTWMRHGHR